MKDVLFHFDSHICPGGSLSVRMVHDSTLRITSEAEVKRPIILQQFVEIKESLEQEVKSLCELEGGKGPRTECRTSAAEEVGGWQSPPFTSEHLKPLNYVICDYEAEHFPGSL